MSLRSLAWLCVVACSLGQTAAAQDDPSDTQIRAAIRKAVRFLKKEQQSDGSWSYGGHEVGITALVGLALAENGVTLDDPALVSAYQLVQANAPSTIQTYDLSLAILFLTRIGNARDGELIDQLGRRLRAGQLNSGGWSYQCPPTVPAGSPATLTNRPQSKPEPPRRSGRLNAAVRAGPGFGDNSNTQFAVLGIWAAGRAGLDISDTMAAVDQRFRSTQTAQGGWAYSPARSDTDAMTCAGLMALLLAKGHRTLEGQMSNRRPDAGQSEDTGEKPKMESDRQIDAGIKRVETYATTMAPGSALYFLWSVERVGVALDSARIGRVEWYSRGAAALLQTQRGNGSWSNGRYHGSGELTDTAFALLFLRRSNLAQGVPQLVTGRSAGSDETKMRAGGLEDLIRTVRPASAPQE